MPMSALMMPCTASTISAFVMTRSRHSASSAVELPNRYAFLTMDEGANRPAERVALAREGNDTWLKFSSSLLVDYPTLAESSFARCICGARAMAATRNNGVVVPFLRAVHFTHAAPAHADAYDRLFAVPVVFGSDRNAWLLEERYVAAMQPRPETYSAHALRKHADALLERIDHASTFRAGVEQLLAARLATGITQAEIARALGMSRQTLLRRLREEGTTYEEVVDELRRRTALQCLERRRLSVKQTAAELGFSDVSAFSRAFKRWTGQRPRAYLALR